LLQLKKAVETMQLGMTITDLEGKIIYTNPAEARMHGYQVEELLGKDVVIFAPPEFRKRVTLKRIKQWKGLIRESVNIHKDGSPFPVWLISEIVKGSDGEPHAIVTSCENISARKQTEEELRKYREHLEELVEERTAELQILNENLEREINDRKQAQKELQKAKDVAEEAQRAAEAANKAKSEFLANMSHELRTPLNAILGYAQILSRDESLTERQRDAVGTIHRSGDHLLSMITEILDLAKIEARKIELEPTELYLPGFLNSIAEMIQVRTYRKGIAFTSDIASDIPKVICCDEKRLRQILLNLLSNAVKFTEEGSVTLRVGYRDREIGR